MDDINAKLESDGALRKKLFGMWADGASADAIAEAMVAEGIEADAAQVESLLQRIQAKRAEEIGFEEIDSDLLEKLAGGGTGIDCSEASDCDESFKEPAYWGLERCYYTQNCDETYRSGVELCVVGAYVCTVTTASKR